MLPNTILKYVQGMQYTKDDIGCSDDEVYIFEKKYILKISSHHERLAREKEKNDWLTKYIPGSTNIFFEKREDKSYYLRTYIDGDSLLSKRFLDNPLLLIDILVNVVNILKDLDDKHCPFKSTNNEGNEFIHGDLCLPNIYVDENNEFIGFIDLDNMGQGDSWYDYAWLIWSFEYNLKTKEYTDLLLDKLNITFSNDMFLRYTSDSE